MKKEMQNEEIRAKVSITLRGEKAERFDEFRKRLSEHLGFNISTGEMIMWAIKHSEDAIDE